MASRGVIIGPQNEVVLDGGGAVGVGVGGGDGLYLPNMALIVTSSSGHPASAASDLELEETDARNSVQI